MQTSTPTVAATHRSFCARISELASGASRAGAAAGACLIAFAIAFPANAAETAGQVQVVVGAAQLIDTAGKERPIERGTEVKQGERIITGDNALVQIKLTDGGLVSVRTNTDVTVETYKYDEKTPQNSSILIKLARGALRSITGLIGGANPGAYKIATPTATIGIRGTDHEPVFIPEPKPGEVPVAPPGTYDKVNSGATVILSNHGLVDIRPGQVGFVPITPGVAPKLLPAIPEFFKRLDPKGEPLVRPAPEGRDGKMLARPQLRALDPAIRPVGGTLEPIKTEGSTLLSPTISPTVIEPTNTLTTTATRLEPTTTTVLQPATTTTIQPTTTLIAPTTTTIQPTTTLIAPTTTTTTRTLSPTTTTISPTLIQR